MGGIPKEAFQGWIYQVGMKTYLDGLPRGSSQTTQAADSREKLSQAMIEDRLIERELRDFADWEDAGCNGTYQTFTSGGSRREEMRIYNVNREGVSASETAQTFGLSRDVVLQRVLGLPVDASSVAPAKAKTPPSITRDRALNALIKAGYRDGLTFERPRRGEVYTASVAARGWIELPDGSMHANPSPAAEAYVGGSQSGWDCWRHDKTGKTLYELRDEMKKSVNQA